MTAETTEWAGPTRFLPPTEPTRRDDGALHYAGITYAVAFGYRPLQLDLWVPATEAPAPLVVWIHGGGFMFGDRRRYGELLARSEEGIASNILADRLKRLTAAGLLTRRPDPTHRQKGIYSLTEASIQLVPLLAHLGAWGRRHTRPSRELSVRAELLEQGGLVQLLGEPRARAHGAAGQPRDGRERGREDVVAGDLARRE